MYQTRSSVNGAKSELDYIEMDPTGRYGRFRGILGKGATKTVFKAFDEVLGMEVAWNQVILNDVFRSPEELQRLYSEVHLLKSLNHHSIMEIYTSWIDVDRRTFNFITEMFTSGTLRQYRQKYKRVDIRAVKTWARQILEGLAYLHCHNPPVIHRDLKCDNIFVNGHLGQVKIGDLGLAATLSGSQHAHSVIGTPEFMAPELYEEDYDELVDIYSFGMCMLEMLTSEYPYSECSNPAQIYKKVTSGKLPTAFYRIEDAEARQFIGKCLESASNRPSANELLVDPFLLAIDKDQHLPATPIRTPTTIDQNKTPNGKIVVEKQFMWAKPKRSTDMTITGTINPEDDTIFLKVQISDQHGKARNIYFPFDIMSDTALDVAMEMVKELEINDWEPLEIADMIDEEISALVPTWKQCDQPSNFHQHSFNYHNDDDDDKEDDTTHHPFYSLSSHSSSQASLPAFFTSCDTQCGHGNVISSGLEWPHEEDYFINDDTSSESSLNSFKYSNVHYCSSNETGFDLSPKTGQMHNSTRFSPQENMTKVGNNQCHLSFQNIQRSSSSNHQHHHNPNYQKMRRNGSLVDTRSQALHRSLVEEINNRRLFKTVGAVENIGYREPTESSRSKGRMGSGLSGKTPRNGHKQGFKW